MCRFTYERYNFHLLSVRWADALHNPESATVVLGIMIQLLLLLPCVFCACECVVPYVEKKKTKTEEGNAD